MDLSNDSLAVCVECGCMVMGPHPCQPRHEPRDVLSRIVFMIQREEMIRQRAKAGR